MNISSAPVPEITTLFFVALIDFKGASEDIE